MKKQGEKTGENIYLCEDGKYRWVYELPLFKTPLIISIVWRIFFFILLGVFAVSFLFSLGQKDFFPEGFLEHLKIFGIALLVMTALVAAGYALYAAMMHGKYIVLFEMDEKGINHKQLESQAKKAKGISAASVAAGLAAGNFGAVSAGLNARTSMYTSFGDVRKVKCSPSLNVIKLRERLSSNQVYVSKGDYEFVKEYILSHCPKAGTGKTKDG